MRYVVLIASALWILLLIAFTAEAHAQTYYQCQEIEGFSSRHRYKHGRTSYMYKYNRKIVLKLLRSRAVIYHAASDGTLHRLAAIRHLDRRESIYFIERTHTGVPIYWSLVSTKNQTFLSGFKTYRFNNHTYTNVAIFQCRYKLARDIPCAYKKSFDSLHFNRKSF